MNGAIQQCLSPFSENDPLETTSGEEGLQRGLLQGRQLQSDLIQQAISEL